MTFPTRSTQELDEGLTIVIPVYNSANILPLLVTRLDAVLTGGATSFEVILVNDGSRDTSWETIQRLAATHPWVRGICLMRNYGQHNALLAGIRAARFDVTVTMDDDLQHPPELLSKLIERLSEGYDVVYAPPEVEQHGLLRDMASVITKIALRSAMGAETAQMVSAWRVFRTDLRGAFEDFHSPHVSIDVLLTWGTTRFSALRLRHDPRTIGESQYTVPKLVKHAANMMTGFSSVPLQIASLIGFAMTLFGVGILCYVLLVFLLRGSAVAGFPFLASIIAIFSGAQLFALGIMGEYLARMHFRTMNKPSYSLRATTDDGHPNQ